MITKVKYIILISYLITSYSCITQDENSTKLVRIEYNQQGMNSDLGVGLWAWPFPVDYDKDGDLDLLVNCPDKPFNGLWLFENTTEEKKQTLKAPVKLAASQRKPSNNRSKRRIYCNDAWSYLPQFLRHFF